MIHFYSARNPPAITDVRDSISGGGGSVCGSDVGGVVGAAVGHVVGAAVMKKAMDDVSSDNLQRHLQVSRSAIILLRRWTPNYSKSTPPHSHHQRCHLKRGQLRSKKR